MILMRVMAGLVQALGAEPPPLLTASPPPDAVATYDRMTRIEPRCQAPAGQDILVCARRGADRYRVPFLVPTPGDPRNLGPHGERAALLYRASPCEESGPFLIGCGMAGVTVSTNLGTGRVERRPLAP